MTMNTNVEIIMEIDKFPVAYRKKRKGSTNEKDNLQLCQTAS